MKTNASIARILEMGANAAIIIAAILFSTVLMKSSLLPSATPTPTDKLPPPITQGMMQKGNIISIPNLAWPRSGQTLLLALSTGCHFCTDSAPFYQRISKEHGATHLVAVFPEEISQGEKYLTKLGVKVDEVKQASFGELGISGTPTLVLVDNAGKVISVWEGALPPNRETEVLGRLKEDIARNQ